MPTSWPVAADLTAWVGASSSDELTALAAGIVEDVTDDTLAKISRAALPASNRPGGSAPDCPPRLRRAIIMDAGRVYARRASRAGFQLTADQIARISSVDPDVSKFMQSLTVWPEA